MFKDEKEELRRLEQALLAQEKDEPEQPRFWEDDCPDEETVVYQNFSNNYGKAYRAYNADKTDQELDSYSETVRTGQAGIRGLVLLACLLTGCIVLVCLYLLLRYGGFF